MFATIVHTVPFFLLDQVHGVVIISWQPLGPLLKVELLVGYGLHVKSHDQLKGAVWE